MLSLRKSWWSEGLNIDFVIVIKTQKEAVRVNGINPIDRELKLMIESPENGMKKNVAKKELFMSLITEIRKTKNKINPKIGISTAISSIEELEILVYDYIPNNKSKFS